MRCPKCRLRVEPDMMVDASRLPGPEKEVCTGCLEFLHRKHGFTRGELHELTTGEKAPDHPYWKNKAKRRGT